MLHKSIKSGFTLIELLVVITIIGILATGAVTVYTSQIQKARDTTRIKDIDALRGAAEQVYQDASEYPHADTFITDMTTYIKRFPSDAKHGQTCNGTNALCGYAYVTGPDSNTIDYGAYEFSTTFENEANRIRKAENDGGLDDVRLEQGLDLDALGTVVSPTGFTPGSGACGPTSGAVASNGTDIIMINGNPATPGNECG